MIRDIDVIIDRVKIRIPSVLIEQLKVSHPGVDDDGLWYFELPGMSRNIQIESPTGDCPFIVEHSDMKTSFEARTARSTDEAVEEIVTYLSKLLGEAQNR